MFVLVTEEGGAQQRLEFSKQKITVGRVQGNDIILSKRNVSKKHAQITLDREQPIVVDLGSTNGTWVNGHRISSPVALKAGDKIYIADFILTLDTGAQRRTQGQRDPSLPPPVPSSVSLSGHAQQALEPEASAPSTDRPAARALEANDAGDLEPETESPAASQGPASDAELKTEVPGPRLSQAAKEPARAKQASRPKLPPFEELMARLAETFDLDDIDAASMREENRWSDARKAIAKALESMKTDGALEAEPDTTFLAEAALHEAVGLGVLDDLLSNEDVREIVVRGTDAVLVDEGKGLKSTDLRFSSGRALQTVAARLAAQSGGSLEDKVAFTGHLSFGPLVSIMQEPLALHGPLIEIRMLRPVTLAGLVEEGWLTPAMADYLSKAVAGRRNIIVTGAQGAGVTTLVSALANSLGPSERTVVVEALPDLQIDRGGVLSLTSLSSGMALSEVIERASRMRAEHLVLDDVSARDAWSALTSLSEREPGHIVGLHAWRAQDAVGAVMLAARCSGAQGASVAKLLASAVDLVVAVERTPGSPRVNTVFQVTGANDDGLQYAPVRL
jgi:pilus assembly protein CpaF